MIMHFRPQSRFSRGIHFLVFYSFVYGKDRLAIARRSLMDRVVTIVSLTRMLVSYMVGIWLGCVVELFISRQ